MFFPFSITLKFGTVRKIRQHPYYNHTTVALKGLGLIVIVSCLRLLVGI